jgi:hypothetical protein
MNLGPFGKLKYLWFLISNWPKFIHCPTFLSSFVIPIFEGASILSLLAFHHYSSTLGKSCSTSIFFQFIYCFIYLTSFIMPFPHGRWPNFYLQFIHFSISFVNLGNFLEFLHCPIFLVHSCPNSQRNQTNFHLHQIFVNFPSSTIVPFAQVSSLAVFPKKLG